MTDDQKRQEELVRAHQAELVLNNALVKEVLDKLEDDILKAWETTPRADTASREQAWLWYITVRKFRNTFLGFIETGKMASIQLEEKRRFNIFKGNR